MKKYKLISILLFASYLFSSCNQTDFDVIPSDQLMGDSLVTTYSISQLIEEFKTDSDAYTDTLNYVGGLFTAKQIKSATPVVISGVITSSDVEGNIYKYIVIQETKSGGMAMKVSVDAGSLSGIYPVGQRVWIQCNNLYLGRYAQSYQLGVRYINLEKSKYKRSIDSTIYRVEPGRIPLPIAQKAIHTYGLPSLANIKPDTMTIAQIKAAGMSVVNKLVCIKNAFFTGKGADYGLPAPILKETDFIFAPSTGGIGYPQSREIQDGTGSVFISTSEYAKFATFKLPDSSNRGNITAIIGWYNDKDFPASSSKIYHQLTIRGLGDLGKGFENYHNSIKK